MDFHDDPLATEIVIRKYLNRTLDAETTNRFASHYLECDRCFQELRVSEMLMLGLSRDRVGRRVIGDVTIFQLEGANPDNKYGGELQELCQLVLQQQDTKVLIDLSRISRIDSAGLAMLIECYSHLIRNRGALKLLNPSPQIRRALSMAKIESVIEAYMDEDEAVRAFNTRATGDS
jgi:anti-anti-sigma factor